jgi:hypothetical protein
MRLTVFNLDGLFAGAANPCLSAGAAHDKLTGKLPNATARLGLFADPITVHTGYSKNPEVLDLVACGTAGCGR